MAVPATLDTVAVVGNGLIGHGMAQIFAAAGREVVMIGRREESLAAAMEKIGKSLADFEAHGLIDAVGVEAAVARIRTSTDLEDAAAAQLVLEAVPADRAVQDEVYGALDRICAPPAVIASGSGQPASDLVSNVRHRGRVIAAHFWYPPQLIPLVEVCAGPETDPDVAPWLCDALPGGREGARHRRSGDPGLSRQPPPVRDPPRGVGALGRGGGLGGGDRHGGEGVHRPAPRDHRPIESADAGGLDTLHAFGAYLIPHLRNDSEPAPAVTELVEAGHRGLPSGRGVYDWSGRDGAALLAEREAELFRHLARDRAKRG